MIKLENLTKVYRVDGRHHVVADNINAVFPSGVSVGLLGRNGAGKSSLLRMISGTMDPTSGRVVSDGAVSFPVGFAGSFHPELTGAQNVRFVARIYGVDTDALVDFVADFAELGHHYGLPIRSYSSGMKARLSFGVSMGIPFETYLLDEVTSVGDARFRRKSERMLMDRLGGAASIYVSHSLGSVRRLCQAGAVLDGGKLYWYDDIEEALDHHDRNMSA